MESIILDDNIEYLILSDVEVDDNKYTLFSNIDDEKDIKIRKSIINNGDEYYVGLDSQGEFEKVILAFDKKLNS